MKSSFDYSKIFQRSDNKIMTNSMIAAFPLLLPFPRGLTQEKRARDTMGKLGILRPARTGKSMEILLRSVIMIAKHGLQAGNLR